MPNEPITIFTNQKYFQVFTNPTLSELLEIGPLVRFTADGKTKNVYVWEFNSGHHADVSIGFKLDDPFNSVDFIKGHAIKIDNSSYEMGGSESRSWLLWERRKRIDIFLIYALLS